MLPTAQILGVERFQQGDHFTLEMGMMFRDYRETVHSPRSGGETSNTEHTLAEPVEYDPGICRG